ncbi:MAG: MFS transporter [Spirochaetaceae bacterium]|nr:MFS transporter [Spirochaetaceae bacterium]
MNKHRQYTPALPSVLFLTLMIFFGMMPRTLLAPLLLRISDDLGISFDRASLFFLSSSAGFITGLLISGFLTQYFTHKWTIVTAILGTSLAAVFLSMVHTELSFHLLMFIGSWALGLYPGSGITTVTSVAPDVHHGKAIAIHEFGPNFTFILAPIIAAAFAPVIGWRGIMMVVGIGGVAAALLFAVIGRFRKEHGEPPNFNNLAELARNRSFWVISALFAVGVAAAAGVYSVLPTYLMIEQGLPEQFVNNLVGASRIAGIAMLIIAGALTDRFGFRPVVSVILLVTGAATLLIGMAHGGLLIAGVFLQPLFVGAFFPVAINELTKVTVPERRSLAVALAFPLSNLIGGGLAPPLLAAAGARGWFSQAFVLLGIIIMASVALLPLMRKTKNS